MKKTAIKFGGETLYNLRFSLLGDVMSEYSAKVIWRLGEDSFQSRRYSRAHKWVFDGGIEVDASASPHIVPLPLSVEAAVDPEEALVAAASSCHMLFFLHYAADAGLDVESYTDNAVGTMGKLESGRIGFTRIVLSPDIAFVGVTPPDADLIGELHRKAHESCFIANTLNCPVEVVDTSAVA